MGRKKQAIFLRSHSARRKHSKRVDLDPQTTSHSGLAGLYELALRRFKTTMYLVTIAPLYAIGAVFLGLALTPPIYIYKHVSPLMASEVGLSEALLMGLALGAGFFIFGFSLIFIVPAANFIMRTNPKTFRGPYYSVDFLRWFVHNSLTYLVRYTFLEFITPTPFNLLFFKMMGMKIGKGTQINSSNISDPALIELGEFVTIGGSATLCAHYGMGGYLILAPVKIGDHVTIGLKASVMGGVEIGAGAKVLPHSVVLPKTMIPPGETWGGVPAQRISIKQRAA
jgi:serine acetyltransferase